MVTKRLFMVATSTACSVLAKIFMVTKLGMYALNPAFCSVLAKIFMVTKPQKYGSTFLSVIEY